MSGVAFVAAFDKDAEGEPLLAAIITFVLSILVGESLAIKQHVKARFRQVQEWSEEELREEELREERKREEQQRP